MRSSRSLSADPSFPDAYNLRGLIYMASGRHARQAEDSFKRAIVASIPRDGDTLHNYRLDVV
jgi:type IV pilus assembly protein PilF